MMRHVHELAFCLGPRALRRGARRLQGLAGLALLMLACAAPAAELQWAGRSFQIIASDKTLPDFLRELAASQGTTAVVDPKIAGTISGKFVAAPLNILNSLCATNGLSWYYDGAYLFIDPIAEARSEMMAVTPGNAARLSDTLARLQIIDRRFPLVISERDGSVHVTGPKRYVELVKQTVRLVDQRSAQTDGAEIQLFPLKFAWAADFKINRAGRETAIPGVANVLRSLYGRSGGGHGGHASAGAGGGRRPSTFAVGANRQLKLSSGETVNAPKIEMPGIDAGEGGEIASSYASGELPQFQADTRMNAVLVRDVPERMAQYARLIAAMDVRPRLLEIEVTIMDISSDTFDSLGVDWRLHGRHGDLQTGRGDRPALSWGGATGEGSQVAGIDGNGQSTTPLGALFTAAIGHDARNYLLARVNALAQKGDANFLARPKVLTLDNTEAVLENLSEFYVRVDGFQDASLFKVTAGTSVRVTPLIVDESTARGVMMSIDIEDGDLSSSAVDKIPVVRRRTVNTQALIDEGTSLLIAGYSSEEKTNATSGVPVLSSIPVLGKLFQYSEKKQNKLERFYLLTPRLVVPGRSGLAAAPSVVPAPALELPKAPMTQQPVPLVTPALPAPLRPQDAPQVTPQVVPQSLPAPVSVPVPATAIPAVLQAPPMPLTPAPITPAPARALTVAAFTPTSLSTSRPNASPKHEASGGMVLPSGRSSHGDSVPMGDEL